MSRPVQSSDIASRDPMLVALHSATPQPLRGETDASPLRRALRMYLEKQPGVLEHSHPASKEDL